MYWRLYRMGFGNEMFPAKKAQSALRPNERGLLKWALLISLFREDPFALFAISLCACLPTPIAIGVGRVFA